MRSAKSDSYNGSVDSVYLPLQAYMLFGRGRRLSAVVPVLLVADSRNIISLLCSTLYQRHVWGIRQPKVFLCCSSTSTIATAIFGWLNFDRKAICSSLAQFVLGLRTHFEDIKGATSIEAVDSLTPLCWRSDLPEFETQFWGQLEERVASGTHQVHGQTSFSEASSSSTPCTHFPILRPLLLDTAPVSYEISIASHHRRA
ncbi:hypothetical protein P692DRAFT_20222765 [Suillus brevipes Sb2]|nr:hypothetical protein P692DRAFT_20222765 [Suillus brevipes Sb2]